MPDYLLTADLVPAVQVPSGLLDPAVSAPPVRQLLATGGSSFDIINASRDHGVAIDAVSRYGGGMVAICEGFDITDGGGLTADVAAGSAMVDGFVTNLAGDSVALTDAARNFLWVGQNGSITPTTSTTPPATPTCYIGNVLCAGGVITSIDLSGVVYLKPLPWRQTADAGEPADTPPNRTLWTLTAGGLYLWTGAAYLELWATP